LDFPILAGARSVIAMKKKILVFSAVNGLAEKVARTAMDHHILCPVTIDEFINLIPQAEIILTDPDSTFATHSHTAKNCKWLQSTWAGVDGFLKNVNYKRPDFILTRFAGTFGRHIAEYCLQHILNHERHYPHVQEMRDNLVWDQQAYPSYRTLNEIKIGVLGFGDIGKEVCRVGKFFDMKVVAYKATIVENPEYIDKLYVKGEFSEFLSDLDYVISTLPSTKETNGLLNDNVLKNCKRSPVFINVGRGNTINEGTILHALEQKWISKAILDVFEREPLPIESKLWKHKDVIITPHVSARTFERDISKVFFDNLELYLGGKPLKHQVEWERGY
jgi:phosphoglycerate dehydrogenase-like enzyme